MSNDVPRRKHWLRCEFGHHDDGTDSFGGYSAYCLRCGRYTFLGMSRWARGTCLIISGIAFDVFGWLYLIGPWSTHAGHGLSATVSFAAGILLVVAGALVIRKALP